jgi:hypothetical protein
VDSKERVLVPTIFLGACFLSFGWKSEKFFLPLQDIV